MKIRTLARPLGWRRSIGIALAKIGGLGFAVVSASVFVCAFRPSQMPILRVVTLLSADVLLLSIAAYMLRAFDWVVPYLVVGLSVGALAAAGGLGSVYIMREPPYATAYEAGLLGVCLAVFACCCTYLRRLR